MLAALPPAPYSNARNSGSMSSQLARRLTRAGFCATALKSGARNGFDICIWRTDCGTTCRSAVVDGLRLGGDDEFVWAELDASGDEQVAAHERARRTVTAVSSARSWMRDVSRAAVLARIVATPSRRLRVSVRSASVSSLSVFAFARSSRMSRAITWNLVRFVGPTLPRSAAPSTSRTARASTG